MSDSKLLSEQELEQRVHDITQTMLIALSEWQAGVPVDYHTAKQLGRSELVSLIKSQKQSHEKSVREDDAYHETQTLEYIKELLSEDEASERENSFVIEVIDEKLGYLLPRDHKDYWKFHCVNCGLWTGHEMEDLGERYCDCE